MSGSKPSLYRAFFILFLVLTITTVDLHTDTPGLGLTAEAQYSDDFWRFVSKMFPTTSRRLSRQAKGEVGEENIEYAMRQYSRHLDEILEMQRIYLRKEALDEGFDGFYRSVSRNRFIAIEAKATTNTGMLYEGILGSTLSGRQMSTSWMRRSLAEAEQQALRVLDDDLANAAQRRAAREILETISEVQGRTLRRCDRVLVVTRLMGLEPDPGLGSSIHRGLARHFDSIIEVNRHGHVLRVFPGG